MIFLILFNAPKILWELPLVIVSIILVVVYFISNNNDKFLQIEKTLDENKHKIEKKITKYKNHINNLTDKNTRLFKRRLNDVYINSIREIARKQNIQL